MRQFTHKEKLKLLKSICMKCLIYLILNLIYRLKNLLCCSLNSSDLNKERKPALKLFTGMLFSQFDRFRDISLLDCLAIYCLFSNIPNTTQEMLM